MTESESGAVVLGASMSGLLAARVLADFYPTVTLVERDVLPDAPANRRGVPQAKQPHILMARAPQILEELFPGFVQELVNLGCPAWKDGDLSKWCLTYGGHQIVRTGTLPQPSEVASYPCTRSLLDWHVRQRLRRFDNIAMIDGYDVQNLTSTPDRDRVTGITLTNRDDGSQATLDAELVVDATGRGSRAPHFLAELGYGRPVEDEVLINLSYACMPVHIHPGTMQHSLITVMPRPGEPRGLVMIECENGTWMVGACAMLGHAVPNNRDELLEFAATLAPTAVLATARQATPLAEVSRYRVPSNRWFRYDRMSRMPEGFLVFGDAICSFNPIYGQGITVAAIESLILRDCLTHIGDGLPRRFIKRSAKVIDTAWQTAVGADLAMPEVKGVRPPGFRLRNAWMERVLVAAETDPTVFQQFLQVTGMTQPPSRLLRPSFVHRVTRAQRRKPRFCQNAVVAAPEKTEAWNDNEFE